jgi:hypothetical protein
VLQLHQQNPELAPLLPDKLHAAWQERLAAGRVNLRVVHSSHIGWHIRSNEGTEQPNKNDRESNGTAAGTPRTAKSSGWNYFDSTETTPPRWLIKGLLPEAGVGILAGQWGSFKTTAALDIAISVMTGTAFAGQYRVKRKGAVLYFAVEGAGTLKSRLEAIARHRGAPERLPFAWRGECPQLTRPDAGKEIVKCVDEAAVHFEHNYGLPITLVWVDTYSNAAGHGSAGDDNDAAATQKAFTTLRFVSAKTGAFVVAVDHYGKILEAGTRGSSSKEGNADTVLATLGERELNNAATNTRLAVRKQRDGVSGFELPFTPEQVEQGLDEDGDPITAIVVDWGEQRSTQAKKPGPKSKNVKLLCRVLVEVVAQKGFPLQPDPKNPGAPHVQACHKADLAAAFDEHHPSKGTGKKSRDSRQRAFGRALQKALDNGLIGMRNGQNGVVSVWPKK